VCRGIFGLLLFFMLSVPMQLIAWKGHHEMTCYMLRGTLITCSLTQSLFSKTAIGRCVALSAVVTDNAGELLDVEVK